MYRIYDKKSERWRSNVVMCDDGMLGVIQKTLFGNYKILPIFDKEPYIIQYCTDIVDMDGQLIYEGDILKSEDGEKQGRVSYHTPYGCFVIFDFDTDTYYYLNEYVGKTAKVVGNVIDGEVNVSKDN